MMDHRIPFTTQERYRLKQMYCLVGSLDHWRGRCAALERQLACQTSEIQRQGVIRDLLHARQAEQQSILDLRDGCSYLVGLVAPTAAPAP